MIAAWIGFMPFRMPVRTTLFFLVATLLEPRLVAQQTYELRHAYSGVQFSDCPVSLAIARDEESRTIVALQRGMVHLLPSDRTGAHAPVFLDFREKLKEEIHFEAGFHALVFHPDFKTNRRVFLSYSQSNPRRNVLSEMLVPSGPEFAADPSTERVILEIPHPLADHYSGSMAFGPDGMLFYAVGDGGLRDDPMGMAQHPFLLQGKILRLDVNQSGSSRPYQTPRDNPFADKQEWRSEIYALGFRNPWGISFDPVTGDLWAADVGQDLHEEINRVVRGGNYGWGERDGTERLGARKDAPAPPEGTVYLDPVHSYSRMNGDGICIVGGMIYRGERLSHLQGTYLFADWGVGKVWAMRPPETPGRRAEEIKLLYITREPGFNPTQICPDENGEPLILNHRGWIEELVPSESP